ncbi:MAG: methylated-DNA--[protein]-cysteine S-methyltransferase [Candidatus Limnocylindrales bacterium]|nr:methylated-DNA--[protein]-cysteine S-methyltransferase [Candidatus Limnocylindrales bacterium]
MDEPVAIRTTFAGRWGPVFIAATDRGVVAIEWLTTEEAFDAAVSRRLGGRVVPAGTVRSKGQRDKHLANGVKWVEAFLSGRPAKNSPPIDLADRPAWDRHVLEAVAAIPWGQTASYGQIACRIGSPRAARAVGGAIGRNPIMFLIPCHRVIASDGTLGGWGGGRWGAQTHRLRNKRDMLLREGVTVAPPAP